MEVAKHDIATSRYWREPRKTGLAPIASHFLSRFRGIRSVPVPFLEVPLTRTQRLQVRSSGSTNNSHEVQE